LWKTFSSTLRSDISGIVVLLTLELRTRLFSENLYKTL